MAGHDIIKREEGSLKSIEIRIVKARKAFKKKDFTTSSEIYNSIEKKIYLTHLIKI